MRKLFFADKKHHEQQAKLAFPTTLKSTLRLGLILREIFTCIPFLFGQLSRKMKRCVYFIKNKFYWQCRLSVSARLGISWSSRECSGWGREHYRVAIAAGSTSERLNNAITRCLCVRFVAGEHHLRAGCRSAGKLGPRKCIIPSN
jgi:hypothetical protein